MKERQYEVEVYSHYSNGRYGKTHYFGWILSSDKKVNAEYFALDILAGMTPEEINKEADGKFAFATVSLPSNQPIGYEKVEQYFSTKARLLRG